MTTPDETAVAKAVALIKEFEGFRAKPYLCPAGVWTIGYGTVLRQSGRRLVGARDEAAARALYPTGIPEARAAAMLRAHVDGFLPALVDLVASDLTAGQWAALISWAYNVGLANVRRSTLLKRLRVGDLAAVPDELRKWVKAGDRKLGGLERRREAEIACWEGR